jgi:flagellar protein FliO/FliZ
MGVGTVVSSIVALVLSLGLVLGLAWGSIYLLRRWQDRSMGGREAGSGNDRPLRFVRALPLGPRERVVLIEVGEELMLLGIGAGGVTLLQRWDEAGAPLPAAAMPAPAAPATPVKPTW